MWCGDYGPNTYYFLSGHTGSVVLYFNNGVAGFCVCSESDIYAGCEGII
jgi:hypothetical protein